MALHAVDARRQRDRLAMIAGAGGDNAAGAFFRGHRADQVQAAAHLEGTGRIVILVLHPDRQAGGLIEQRVAHQRRSRTCGDTRSRASVDVVQGRCESMPWSNSTSLWLRWIKPFVACRDRNVGPVRDYPVYAPIQQAPDVVALVDDPYLQRRGPRDGPGARTPATQRACGRHTPAPGRRSRAVAQSTAIAPTSDAASSVLRFATRWWSRPETPRG